MVSADVNQTDTITVNVEVAQRTLVNVNPTSLSWSSGGSDSVYPGSDSSVKAIQIENIGSTNITQIWFNTTYPDSNPFASGTASTHNAGNFIALRENSSSAKWFFANRVDWKEQQALIYVTIPSGWTSGQYGRFKISDHEYFWAANESTLGKGCNETGAYFRIGKDPHNESNQGTVDLTTCDATLTDAAGGNDCRAGTLTNDASNSGWGYADVFVGPNSDYYNYTVAVNHGCNTTMWVHWNMDAPGASGGTHAQYFRNSTLVPGNLTIANVMARVPYGVHYGTTTPGTLTILVQAIGASA